MNDVDSPEDEIVCLVNAIMAEDIERTEKDPATQALINSIVNEETEHSGKDSATLALVHSLQQENSQQVDLGVPEHYYLKLDDESYPPLKQ